MKFYISWDGVDREIKMPIKAENIYEALNVHKSMQSKDTHDRDFRLVMISKSGLPLIIG